MRRAAPYLIGLALGFALAPLRDQTEAADAGTLEYAVKANFLYKFGDYVSWPPDALGPEENALPLCVVGDDPFGKVLDDAVKGEHVGKHAIAVKRMTEVTPDAVCRILFARTPAALKAVAGSAVLTISEAAGDEVATGAVITFVIRNNRVRFAIDQQAAAANGLEISSKLLELAVAVTPRTGSGR